jgi:hypothetical protein
MLEDIRKVQNGLMELRLPLPLSLLEDYESTTPCMNGLLDPVVPRSVNCFYSTIRETLRSHILSSL